MVVELDEIAPLREKRPTLSRTEANLAHFGLL
jgi:hypothetical protein